MDRAKFFSAVRSSLFGGKLSQVQVDGLDAVLDEWEKGGHSDIRWLAYILATAHHETGGRFSAVTENLNYSAKRLTQVWPSRFPTIAAATPFANNPQALANKVYGGRMGNTGPNDGFRYLGRGLVQITGKDNYRKYGLENNPEAAAEIKTAAHIIVDGMVHGRFTGQSLSRYFDHDSDDPVGARKIINPDSNGGKIATEYRAYLSALRTAGG